MGYNKEGFCSNTFTSLETRFSFPQITPKKLRSCILKLLEGLKRAHRQTYFLFQGKPLSASSTSFDYFFFAPAHWFTLHTQCLAPRSWFVFLSRLQLSPNRYKCASVAGKWRAWEVPDWIRLRVHPIQLQMPRGALREERQGAVLEGRALPVVLPFACWWVCPSWWHISHLSFAHTCKIPDPWLQMASHKGWDETTNF